MKIWKCSDCNWECDATAPGSWQMYIKHQTEAQDAEGRKHNIYLVDKESGEMFTDKEGNYIRSNTKAQSLGLLSGTPGRKGRGSREAESRKLGSREAGKQPEVISVTLARESESEAPSGEKGKDEKKLPTVSPLAVSIYRMVPLQATVYNTPGKWASYACAVAEGYQGGFDEFVEVAMLDFWLGRRINPFERLAVLFEGVPSDLREKLEKFSGGVYVPERLGVVEKPTEEKPK